MQNIKYKDIAINYKYYLLGIILVLFQFAGYNVLTLSLLAISTYILFSFDVFINSIKTIPVFAIFITLSLSIGLVNIIFHDTTTKSLMMWGQFYFFAFMLLGVRNKMQLINTLKIFAYLIFIADVTSNLLLALGFNLPWTSFPPVRPGELFARFPGVKGNSLFSGSISFLSICFFSQENLKNKILKYFIFIIMLTNLLMASSFRYYVIFLAIFILNRYRLYNKRSLCYVYISFIFIIVVLTNLTTTISGSNNLRWQLWLHAISQIQNNPLTGIGFFYQDLNDFTVFSLHNLTLAGVTESTILALAICFGIPIALLFVLTIYNTLKKYKEYRIYSLELGIFYGLSLDLFWGGPLDNCFSLTIILLCLYIINYNGYIITKAKIYNQDERLHNNNTDIQ